MPFPSPAWLIAWWQSFSTGELATIAVRDAYGDPVGLAPLYLERSTGQAPAAARHRGQRRSDRLIDDERGDGVAAKLADEFPALPWDSCSLEAGHRPRDLGKMARRHGLDVAVDGERPFTHWDGKAFHLVRTIRPSAG